MAFAHAPKATTAPKGIFAALIAAVKTTLQSIYEATEQREAYHALNRMSDRELDDMGLTRGEIVARVFQNYPRR